MHQPVQLFQRAALGIGALLLSCTAHAQTTPAVQESMPEAQRAPAVMARDQNTPAPVARQQRAELAKGDPARWYQEDETMAERMRTMRKDIAAGLQENLGACRSRPAAERSACMRDARATYRQEMADVGRMR
ncbi:hypothetical protein KY495_00845 [Massilia sp. PAMC28688]|uniref:hypothetical protein n=1 Tax=Massilia sp. PAMC28688 TaxID=2861283 RepID=UPI001C627895|nr:hypothetical protein [Massilia sp. PAMC28688]QYF93822.1 hypothetical protein KY495_00845 [Massilia sp. PAMC28688]